MGVDSGDENVDEEDAREWQGEDAVLRVGVVALEAEDAGFKPAAI